jgi:hypothetical protein
MVSRHTNPPFWLDEPDWLCSVEFLPEDDPEGREDTADTIGYLLGYAHMTNTRLLALLADPHEVAYEILFSFHSPELKAKFMGLIRSNQELGNDYIENDLMRPTVEEIRNARPLAAVLPDEVMARVALLATAVCTDSPSRFLN